MTKPAPIGSDAWIGADDYDAPRTKRIVDFMAAANEKALKSYASSLRNHQSCNISDKFSMGTTHLVRKLQFDDGVQWIARLRMPRLNGSTTNRKQDLSEMRCELDTVEFVCLAKKTDIPIPRLHGHDLSHQNAVGCPFFLMDYLRGNIAHEVAMGLPGEYGAIPNKFQDRFWRQIAWIMVQLASVRAPKIGSLCRDAADLDAFTVGPIVETGSGPYDPVAQFYDEYPLALHGSLRKEEEVEGQRALLRYFQELMKSFTQAPTSSKGDKDYLGGFGLRNGDLGLNNVLVDHELNILCGN